MLSFILIKTHKYFYTNRKNSRYYTIVVTDGHCSHQYLSSLSADAAALRSQNILGNAREERQVWAIGVGPADMKELRNISGIDFRTLYIEDFTRKKEIKEVQMKKR